jgi:hypothetical protein
MKELTTWACSQKRPDGVLTKFVLLEVNQGTLEMLSDERLQFEEE